MAVIAFETPVAESLRVGSQVDIAHRAVVHAQMAGRIGALFRIADEIPLRVHGFREHVGADERLCHHLVVENGIGVDQVCLPCRDPR